MLNSQQKDNQITRTARITRKKTIPLLLSESKWAKEAISCIKELKLIKTRPIQKPRTQKDTESEQTTSLDSKTQAQTGYEHNWAI